MEHNALILSGMSVLVVEDDPLIALDVSMILEDAGASVIGPFESDAQVRPLMVEASVPTPIQAAVLDVELRDGTSTPVARWLQNRGIPFIFHTGMNPAEMRKLSEFDTVIVTKPSTRNDLIAAVSQQLKI